MTKLTPQADQALRDLRAKDLEYRERKAKLELDLKQEMAERLRGIRKERDNALIFAAQVGVPRTQLGKAIGTTNYKTVQDILAEGEPSVVKSELGWSLTKSPNGDSYSLHISDLGHARVTGTATIRINDGDIEFVSGDEFVLPVIYREGIAPEVIANA